MSGNTGAERETVFRKRNPVFSHLLLPLGFFLSLSFAVCFDFLFRPVLLDVSTTSFVSLMHAPHRHQHDGRRKPTATCVCVYIYLAVAGCNEFKRVARIVNLFSQLARGACRDGGYVGRDYRKSISFFPSFL